MLCLVLYSQIEKEAPSKSVPPPNWGKENPIPRSLVVRMVGVPTSYKRSYLNKLTGYMCDLCGETDLGEDTRRSDHNNAYLYWLETGNQPFDGAVCTTCYGLPPALSQLGLEGEGKGLIRSRRSKRNRK